MFGRGNSILTGPADRVESDKRTARYRARDFLRHVTDLRRVRHCGHSAVTPGGAVAIKATGTGSSRSAGFSGLATCGSVWACPVCAAKIASERVEQIGSAASAVLNDGGSVLLLTLTMRHDKGHALVDEWDALTAAWQGVTNSRGWREEVERYGLLGWARAVEATHGENGWHLHAHVLLFVDRRLTKDDAAQWLRRVEAPKRGKVKDAGIGVRWESALGRRGFTASVEHGSDLRVLSGRAEAVKVYPVKSLAWEAAGGQGKDGRNGSRTPFGILRDLMASGVVGGESADLALWQEWEAASFRRRQLTWSRGFLASLAIADRSDEEIADEDLAGDVLVVLPAESWAAIRQDAALRVRLLLAAESDDTGRALSDCLDSLGVVWLTWGQWRLALAA